MVRRTLLALLFIFVPFLSARAQNESIWVILSPADLPKPSMKHRLLPDRRDLVHGNAAALYYRAMASFVENRFLLMDLNEQHWDRWMNTPVDELPKDEVRTKVNQTRNLIREFEEGARQRQCDWNLDNRSEGFLLLIPEVQGMRRIGTVLAVRAKLAMAEGRLDDALASLRIGFALGHHLGDSPTFIHTLVGLAIAQIMCNRLEDFIQRPGAPNLYWSLAVMPRPWSDLKKAWDTERDWLDYMYPAFKRLEDGPMSLAQLRRFHEEVERVNERANIRQPTPEERVQSGVFQALAYPEAKRGLLSQGVKAADVDAMPPFQVVALFAWREYHRTWDEAAKWAQTPDGTRHPGYRTATREQQKAVVRLNRIVFQGRMADIGFPAVDRVQHAIARLERRFAALRCLEAIRLYAAKNDGKLPASLKDITDVPVPTDPMSGQPFEYIVKGDRATLNSPVLKNDPIDRGVVYLLQMRR